MANFTDKVTRRPPGTLRNYGILMARGVKLILKLIAHALTYETLPYQHLCVIV